MEELDITTPKGKGSICHYCGFISGLKNRCERCNRKLMDSAMLVDFPTNVTSLPLSQLQAFTEEGLQKPDISLPKGKVVACDYCGFLSSTLNRCQRCKHGFAGAIRVIDSPPGYEPVISSDPLLQGSEDIPAPEGKTVVCLFCGFVSNLMNKCSGCKKRYFTLINVSPSCSMPPLEMAQPSTTGEEANAFTGIRIKEESEANEIPKDSNPATEVVAITGVEIKQEPETNNSPDGLKSSDNAKSEAAASTGMRIKQEPEADSSQTGGSTGVVQKTVNQKPREKTGTKPSGADRTGTKEQDVPSPKGKGAVCHYCGYVSHLINRCQRCKRKLTGFVKLIDVPTSSPAAQPSRAAEVQQIYGKCYSRKPKANQNRPQSQAPECMALGLLECDMDHPVVSRASDEPEAKKLRTYERKPRDVPSSPEVTKGPTVEPIDEETSDQKKWNDAGLKGSFYAVKCRSARIGSYEVVPKGPLLFSSDGILMEVPVVSGNGRASFKETVTITLPKIHILKVDVHFGKNLQALFICLTPVACRDVRDHLRMSRDVSWFDCLSNVEAHKRIILLLEQVTDEVKKGIINAFSVMGVYHRLSAAETNDILVRSIPSKCA